MKSFTITNIPEFSNKDRIVVIGVIGKSPYRYCNKTAPLIPSVKSDEITMSVTGQSSGRKMTTCRQLELLVDYLSRHKDLAIGRMRGKEARAVAGRLWKECALILNSKGTYRSPHDWSRYWTDCKRRLKAKLRLINRHKTGTGEAPPLEWKLTPIENKIAEIIGRDAVDSSPGLKHDPFSGQDLQGATSPSRSSPCHEYILGHNTLETSQPAITSQPQTSTSQPQFEPPDWESKSNQENETRNIFSRMEEAKIIEACNEQTEVIRQLVAAVNRVADAIFSLGPSAPSPTETAFRNGIECFWDERNSVLYLHAVTYLDTNRLEELISRLGEDNKGSEKEVDPAHWLVASGELAVESCRFLALLFHLCHIVVLSSPTPVFDLGYLQLFRAIDAFRNELSAQTAEALADSGAGGNWESHGRGCCPRLLFHFRSAPRQLRRVPAALKRLEHAVEDQLYSILRKSRIITNVCAKSLFAIPKNEEFVYISAEEVVGRARDMSVLLRGLVGLCTGEGAKVPAPEGRPGFKQFLQTHIDLAFGEGFDDNVGKYAMSTSYFELPSATSWRLAAQALTPLYLDNKSDDVEDPGALWDALATDVRFSKARCAKVLPIAQASYTEGLPPHYSSQHHIHKVGVGVGVLETMARGPLAAHTHARLVAACEATWRARRLCEALSLTANPCIKPLHENEEEHSSGVRYVSACNCGRNKSTREDPYSVKRANCTFYSEAAVECGACSSSDVHFPVFQPSTNTYKAASVKVDSEGGESEEVAADISEGGRGEDGDTQGEAPEGAWSGSPEALSPGSQGASDDDQEASPKPPNSPNKYELVALRDDSNTDKGIVRQPSTTEYLPGMLHLESPPGLLPAFSSWWLVCLGASSLYSHNMGLPEHLQPGFLPHTNYLLPWDCAVRMEQVSSWRSAPRGRGGGAGGKHHHLTVKIFIGFEYECARGHRFMMSSPECVVSGCVPGGGAGAALAGCDMPLYTICPCRTMLAQLTRIHVVTPKAPVHVTLNPRVQPVTGGATFVPQPPGSAPVRLSGSSYWVLRLPYIYCGERGALPRPSVPPAPAHVGKLLAPLFGLAD